MFRYSIALALAISIGSPLAVRASEKPALSKITFDLSKISEEGLIGRGSGVRSFAYEFCIPAIPTRVAEVRAIDPSLKIYRQSPGRIRCRKDQYLCVGETYQPRWRERLLNLAELDYIEKIQPFYGE
jgi:hypothetical protein